MIGMTLGIARRSACHYSRHHKTRAVVYPCGDGSYQWTKRPPDNIWPADRNLPVAFFDNGIEESDQRSGEAA